MAFVRIVAAAAATAISATKFDIDLATGFVDSRRLPLNQPAMVHGGFGRQRHLKVAIGTIFRTWARRADQIGLYCSLLLSNELRIRMTYFDLDPDL